MTGEVNFLTVDQVIQLHSDGISLYGGDPGLRDHGLVESATLAPQQTFGDRYLCADLAEMAATYWCGLTSNHGFVDGNKRVGLAACDVFLALNGYDLNLDDESEAYELALQIACGEVTKGQVAERIRRAMRPLS